MEIKIYLTSKTEFIQLPTSEWWYFINLFHNFKDFFYQCIFIRSEANNPEILNISNAHQEATDSQRFLKISSIKKINFRIQVARTCTAQIQANIFLEFTCFWELI